MNPAEIIDACRRHYILVRRVGEDLEMEPVFPETHPMPVGLVEEMRRHKSEVLTWLRWHEQADALLAERLRRLAEAWPPACAVEGPIWDRHEKEIHQAYTERDLDRLNSTLEAREDYAMTLFGAYKTKCEAQ
jgi:hypothetical protein